MSSVLVRELSQETIDRLKKRAARKNRSLQAELKVILEEAAEKPDLRAAAELAREIRGRTAGRVHTDSADLLREDRER